MKEIADQLCKALVFAGEIKSQADFSRNWLGRCPSYLSAIKAMEGHDLSKPAMASLRSRIDGWLEGMDEQGGNLILRHAAETARTTQAALVEHIEKKHSLEELNHDTHDRRTN